MLRTLNSRSLGRILVFAKRDGVLLSRIDCRLAHNARTFVRPFGTEVSEKKEEKKSILETDEGYTPEGAVFTNPNVSSDWIYREEKDTKRQYYINTKTNEIVFNRTTDSMLAPRWRRIAAGGIDFAASLRMALCLL